MNKQTEKKFITTVKFRNCLSEFVNEAAYGEKEIIIHRRQKPLAVLISYKLYQELTSKPKEGK